MDKEFGKIVEIDPRQVFKDERNDFTPWLNDNIDLLSKLLGLEIIDNQIEVGVGDFRLDIMGKDANSKSIVAIENQLERTDHNHLGQIITYTAGSKAEIVIWIAKEIRPEHEAALEWLNENSGSQFFGLEIRIIRVDDSKPALDFKIKVMPTDWTTEVKSISSEVSSRNELYRQFFTNLMEQYHKQYPNQPKLKALPQSWLGFGAGRTGLGFNWAFRGNKRFSVELYINTSDQVKNKDYFDKIGENKGEIGIDGISWERLDEKQASRIAIYTDGDIQEIMNDDMEREKLIHWGVETMKDFSDKLKKIVKKL